MSKVLSTFSRRTQHIQEGIMAGQVQEGILEHGRGGVREGGRAGYLKGDRVRVWCASRDNDELPEVFSPQAWRVVDFMGDKIGVVPEIHVWKRSFVGEKMRAKFYVPPDQLTFITPPHSAKHLCYGHLGVFAERSVRRAKQAAGGHSRMPGGPLRRSPVTAACKAPARISRADPISYGFPADCKCWKCNYRFCKSSQHCRCGRVARCQAITCRARFHQ